MRGLMLTAAGACVVSLACAGGTPATPTSLARAPKVLAAPQQQPAGVEPVSISGTMQLLGLGAPARVLMTPSNICHHWDMDEFSQFTGDVSGPVTFHASATRTCDMTHLVAHGPFEGQVTFQGRTGTMTGMWTTNCKWDDASNFVSCGGIMNARGEGDLEGVQFQFEWGPGWWPFSYTGVAR